MKTTENLSIEEIVELEEELVNRLYDRVWCKENGIDYCTNKDIQKAREIVYGNYLGVYW